MTEGNPWPNTTHYCFHWAGTYSNIIIFKNRVQVACSIFYSHKYSFHNGYLQTPHKFDWIITDSCPLCLAFLRTSLVWWKFLKWNVWGFVFSRILLLLLSLRTCLSPPHVCCSVFLSVYCVHIASCWLLLGYRYLLLIIFVLAAFAYCFLV